MPRKTDGQKVDDLKELCATFVEQLRVHGEQLKGGGEFQLKMVEAIAVVHKDIALVRKDIDLLHTWKDDTKKEKEEKVRRFWSFGPALTSASISGLIAAIGVGVNVWLNVYLKKP